MSYNNPTNVVFPDKSSGQEQAIPTAWRHPIREIVKAFVDHDYCLKAGVLNVEVISQATAKQIKDYIEDYGELLVQLPDAAWETSVCVWWESHWNVLVDLWTQSEGRSDLVLSARVIDTEQNFSIRVVMVYVP
jgi:hypothetical protein